MTAIRTEAINGIDEVVVLYCDGEGEDGQGCCNSISDQDTGGWLKIRHARYVAHFRHGWYNLSGRDLCFNHCRVFRHDAYHPNYLVRRKVELIEAGLIPKWNVTDADFQKYRTRDQED